MTKELITRIEIDAPAEQVWKHLTDFKNYPEWNPFVPFVLGEAKQGKSLHAVLALPGKGQLVFHSEVLKVEPNKELRWKDRWFKGFLVGEHFFKILPLEDNRVLFMQGEVFTGLLVPFVKKVIDGATAAGFKAMNEALKKRSEQASPV